MDQPDERVARTLSVGERLLSLALRSIPIKHGKHRLLDKICPSAWRGRDLLVWVPFGGHRLRISIDELVGWHFAMLRSFDPEVCEVLLAAGRDLDAVVMWDVGANKGACSYAISRRLPGARVVAIEPQVGLEADVRFNLDQLCANRYRFVRAGIGAREETLELVIPASNTGKASLHSRGAREGDRVEQIQVVRAERVEQESGWGWPDLVKIDVEGHEAAVVGSLQAGLGCGQIKLIVFECHAHEHQQFSEIRAIADEAGYVVFGIRKNVFSTRLVYSPEHVKGMTDYVIVHREWLCGAHHLRRLVQDYATIPVAG